MKLLESDWKITRATRTQSTNLALFMYGVVKLKDQNWKIMN